MQLSSGKVYGSTGKWRLRDSEGYLRANNLKGVLLGWSEIVTNGESSPLS